VTSELVAIKKVSLWKLLLKFLAISEKTIILFCIFVVIIVIIFLNILLYFKYEETKINYVN
jgi:hypothetical protein